MSSMTFWYLWGGVLVVAYRYLPFSKVCYCLLVRLLLLAYPTVTTLMLIAYPTVTTLMVVIAHPSSCF